MSDCRKKKRIYIFDTSAFITLSRTSENVIKIPDLLWRHLEKMLESGEIISHRVVFNEINSNRKNPDFITQWVKDKVDYFLLKTDFQRVQIPQIVQRFPGLIDYQSEKEQADPWLIALALEKSQEENLFEVCVSIVVSQENPKSSKKIPEACKCFNIGHHSLREFFDEIGLSTKLAKK